MKINLDKITKVSIILGMFLVSLFILYFLFYLPIKAKVEAKTKIYCDRCLQTALEENYKEYEQSCDTVAIKSEILKLRCSQENYRKFLENPCVRKCIKGEDRLDTLEKIAKIRGEYHIKKIDERLANLEQLEGLLKLKEILEKNH